MADAVYVRQKVRNNGMNKKLAELIVSKSADYYDKVVKALEDAGFIIILSTETATDSYYIVAENKNKK